MALNDSNTQKASMIEHVLSGFLSADSGTRREAQTWLETTELPAVLEALLVAAESCHDSELRGLAWVLLRGRLRKLKPEEYGIYMDYIKCKIAPESLRLFTTECDVTVRQRQRGGIAAIAELLVSSGDTWVELWSLLHTWLTETAERRRAALQLLECLAEHASLLALFDTDAQNLMTVLNPLLGGLSDESEGVFQVVCAMVEGIASFNAGVTAMTKITNPKLKTQKQFPLLRKQLKILAAPMIDTLKAATARCSEGVPQREQFRHMLELAAQICEANPSFWTVQPLPLLQLARELVVNLETDTGFRRSALQISFRLCPELLKRSSTEGLPSKNDILEHLQSLIRTVVNQTTQFDESDEEWLQANDDTTPDVDINTPMQMLLMSLSDLVTASSTPESLIQMILHEASELAAMERPISAVAGLRILDIFALDKAALARHASTDQLLSIALRTLQASKEMRVRWMSMTLLCSLLESDAPSIQRRHARSILEALAVAARDTGAVTRLKRRTITALYAFFSAVDHDTDPDLVDIDTLAAILSSVVTPAIIASDDTQLQELAFALAGSLATLAGEKFQPFYADCLSAVGVVLQNAKTAKARGTENLRLCEAVLGLASAACRAVGRDVCHKELPMLCDETLSLLELAAGETGDADNTSLSYSVLMDILTTLADVAGPAFIPFCSRAAHRIFTTLKQSDAAVHASGTLSLELLGRMVAGKMECSETASGVTQVAVKTATGNNEIFEFKTKIIEEKIAALEGLASIATAVRDGWMPYHQESRIAVMNELQSNYSVLRAPAAEAALALVTILIPGSEEENVCRAASRCALSTGKVSVEDFFSVVSVFCTTLLSTLGPQPTVARASEILPTVEEMLEALRDASKLRPFPTDSAALKLIELLFAEFGKVMVLTVTSELETHQKGNDEHDTWEDESHDSEQTEEFEEDKEGTIYSAIMRATSHLFEVYGTVCTSYFETHLHTPFSALLTAPEVNMAGRAASLFAFANYIEFGSAAIASTVLPVALLYARCNEVVPGLEVDDDDVERVQAAAYCIGLISQANPAEFRNHFDTAIKTLYQVLEHPHAKAEARLRAGECAFGALLKIFINPVYRQDLDAKGLRPQNLVELLSGWFPPEQDEDECRNLTDLLVTCVLNETLTDWLSDVTLRRQLLRCFEELLQIATTEPERIEKETRCSGKLYDVVRILKHST